MPVPIHTVKLSPQAAFALRSLASRHYEAFVNTLCDKGVPADAAEDEAETVLVRLGNVPCPEPVLPTR